MSPAVARVAVAHAPAAPAGEHSCPGSAAQRLQHPGAAAPAVVGPGGCHSFACAVIDGLVDQMAVLGVDGTIIAVNRAWRDFAAADRKPGAAPLHTYLGADYLGVCRAAGEEGAAAAAGIGSVLAGAAASFTLEYECQGPDRLRWFRMTVAPLGYGWAGAVVVHHDITVQREAEASLRIAAVAIDSFDGVMVTDAQGNIVRVNRGFTRITGYTAEEAVGRRPSMLSSGRHDAAFYRQMWDAIGSVGHWQGEIWNRRKGGELYAEYLSIAAVRDAQGALIHYVAVLSDITERKADSDAIREMAFFDPLTRLPNRRLLLDRLGQQLNARERRDSHGALLFIDLDNFKSLNDKFGHNTGDLLLQQVAGRLRDSVRQVDTVARLGGDEFVVLCDGLRADSALSEATALGGKLLAALNLPYLLGTHVWHSTPSIGVTLFGPDAGQQAADLLMQADVAMYQAKRAGRNGMRFFDQDMQDAIDLRGERVRQLRGAIALQQFELFFQLQRDADGGPEGAEVQLCWRHADGTLETSEQFIGLAEEAGLLVPLGDWMLEQVGMQLHRWRGLPLLGALVLSVDFGAAQWREPDFCARVQAALARHDADASRLCLDLPASLLSEPGHPAIDAIGELAGRGVRFAVDGDGGHASLMQVKRSPLSQLNIGPSLVAGLADDRDAVDVVRAIVALADALGLAVFAAGVETDAQRVQLQCLGVSRCQGRCHAPPLPLPEFEARVLSATSVAV